MKPITKYEANDGSEWRTEKECIERDTLCARVEALMKQWPEHPKNDGCSFANGEGFLQLTKELFETTRESLLDIIAESIDHKWVNDSRGGKAHPSWVGRLLSDAGADPLYRAWVRIACVDKQFREWGQVYYAENPTEGKQIKLK